MKVKKFNVLTVPLEVEYKKPILRRVFGLFIWLMLVRVKKFNLTMNGVNPYGKAVQKAHIQLLHPDRSPLPERRWG